MPLGALNLPADLAGFWTETRRKIEDALDRQLPALGSSPPVLHEAMHYTLLARGKRVRGVLVVAVAEMLRGSQEQALAPACAVEMVHAASLILDDLPAMDDASVRRGKPVLHRVVGEANALLTAVALLNAAYDCLHRAEGIKDRLRRQIIGRLAWAVGARGLIGGQIVDLESTGKKLDLETLEFIHSHKTGALFNAAAEMGALVSGAKTSEIDQLSRYAKNLGLAFQITDDLLDYSGNPDITGKDAGLDRDKTTFVDLCGIDGARKLTDELIDAALASLGSFGRRSRRLAALAEFVRSRDR